MDLQLRSTGMVAVVCLFTGLELTRQTEEAGTELRSFCLRLEHWDYLPVIPPAAKLFESK